MMASVTGDEKVYCPYCRTVSNFYFPFNSRKYYRCPSCDLIFLRPKEGGAADVAYYRERYFDDYAEDQISGQRVNLYLHVLDLLDGYRKPGSLLDVGCGCGFFLKEARERGWNASGVDLSEKSIAYAKKLVGDTVLCGSVDDVPTDRSFEAITMINVLDHMDDPFGQLKKVNNLLASGGILYLRFPNGALHSFMMRLSLRLSSKQFMNPFLVFHEYAFTQRAIKRILEDMGFAHVMVFNSHLTGGNFPIAKILNRLIWGFFKSVGKISGGCLLWGPSLEVIAKKE